MFLPRSNTKEEVFMVGSMAQVKLTPVARDAIKESVTEWRFPHASIPGQGVHCDKKFFTVVPFAHQYTLGEEGAIMNSPFPMYGVPPPPS